MRKYFCKHCKCTVTRRSRKAWVKSFCVLAARTVHLTRARRGRA